MSPEIIPFTLLYVLFCFCLILPPTEFISAGVTIPVMCSSLLGSETEQFITYHIKRSNWTLFIYSLLPLGYMLGLWFFNYSVNALFLLAYKEYLLWQCFLTASSVLPLLALYQIKTWSRDNWKEHPITKNIAKFCNNNSSWVTVASDINNEYRRIDKICIETNALSKIIATENWIMKVTPLTIFIAHQSDTTLELNQTDIHELNPTNLDQIQFLNIEVKSSRQNVNPFNIRINVVDFKDLQDRLARPITILPNVKFYKTQTDRFIDTFKELALDNPRYVVQQELENCIGCMLTRANVKLQKVCSSDGEDECVTCYCRPMWCIGCMARWFASRQDSEQPETWLSSKCTCPMCRAKFCVLDVCLTDN